VYLVMLVDSHRGAQAMGMVGMYSQVFAPVSQYVSDIVVLIGLAVAVDYSLFVISRFRTERLAGRDKLCAIEIASSTAGRAVFFSGLAVMISLGALFLIDDSLFKSIAIGSIAGTSNFHARRGETLVDFLLTTVHLRHDPGITISLVGFIRGHDLTSPTLPERCTHPSRWYWSVR